MKLSTEIAPGGPGYWYIASPFTNYPEGHKRAWLDISRIRGELVHMGINAYSPIAETWGAVSQLKLPVDHIFWQTDNESKMLPAVGLIIVKLVSWDRSDGIRRERKWFEDAGKPLVWCDPYA